MLWDPQAASGGVDGPVLREVSRWVYQAVPACSRDQAPMRGGRVKQDVCVENADRPGPKGPGRKSEGKEEVGF
jgi:hypothetical protein